MAPSLSDDQISTIAGYMSLACWIVVYSPQIWENYQLKSGEGLSVTFIILWLFGDITNFVGGAMANLLPTVVILAVYYTGCDLVLLAQVYYYRRLNAQKAERAEARRQSHSGQSEDTPLLPVQPTPAQPKPLLPPSLEYPVLLLFVLGAGVGAWYLSDDTDVNIPEKPGKGSEVELEWKSQTLGWISAVLYLGSRVPQIAHNYKTRCAGLSLAMFFFSISGNLTYVVSILIISVEPRYLLANASWLAGSGLTIFLDLFVLGQFAVFSYQDRKAEENKVFLDAEIASDDD